MNSEDPSGQEDVSADASARPVSRAGSSTVSPASSAPYPTIPAGAKNQLARFFILPAIIVGVCGFCLLLAGGLYVLLKESSDPSSYIEQVVSGSGNKRWQAAYELSKIIAAEDGAVDDATAA